MLHHRSRILAAPCAAAVFLLAAPAPAVASGAAAPELLAVRAARIELGDGRTVEDGVLLVEDGRIRAVGRGVDIPSAAAVIDHDGVLTAGIVAFQAHSGIWSDASDSTRAMMPEARLRDAFEPDHPEMADLVEAGITSVVLTPRARTAVGGVTAVVKTAGGRVLSDEAHLAIAMTASALPRDRRPTSLGGLVQDLDQRMAETEGTFAQAAAGRLPVLIQVGPRHEILRALDFASRHGLRGALVGAPLAGELVEPLRGSNLGVVVGPLGVGTSERTLEAVAALGAAGLPLGFAVGSPAHSPVTPRLAAAMCVRAGLDPIAAWKALTADAALLAGVGESVGRLERGMDADFVLWSGDPLELQSSVEAVYVDGRRMNGGER